MNSIIKMLIIGSLVFSSISQAGITIGATRVIYHGDVKDESVTIINDDKEPYLIQSWAQTINNDDSTADAPFIVTPPLFRLNSGQKNVLRIIRTGKEFPQDRESLYWLDIKSIPSSKNEDNRNKIRLAVKAEFKLIYRPDTLKETSEKTTQQLRWKKQGNTLTVENPTAYYMNFSDISVGSQKLKAPKYAAPFSHTQYVLPAGANGTVSWAIINDYGGVGPVHKQAL
ncbi:long polar fimbrial chaperone LpfB [Klebsiella huaxiensis]|uniref:Fimbria/pilus periplasmic chaperone n=1 Tax=Klebsiella huaxiensis TaxID=2153354 RepID=A0ABT6E7U4_9ENTR|nr:fimbria/pilus periplasmic chaperone [Klebsiella huaxiensis]MDG1641466.1 fimbria/pilus periplasmic chaperone [Klebsiella huaxiensis]QBG09925.1 long polar fimbrial chaperone LpfB [Klebsiella huaxiensis]VUS96065.1 Chaperone protein FimC [Klebsiella huaxiensis]